MVLSVTYVSAASSFFSGQELTELLTRCRSKNAALGLTGVLLYHDGNFMQTIEGPDELVASVFADIKLDLRHSGVSVVLWNRLDEREFPEWSMGFRSLTNGEADSLLGPTGSGEPQGQQVSRAEAFHRIFRESVR